MDANERDAQAADDEGRPVTAGRDDTEGGAPQAPQTPDAVTQPTAHVPGAPSRSDGPVPAHDLVHRSWSTRTRVLVGAGGAAAALLLVTGGFAGGAVAMRVLDVAQAAEQGTVTAQTPTDTAPDGSTTVPDFGGSQTLPFGGSGGSGGTGGSSSSSAESLETETAPASDAQQVGVVTIDTELYYGEGAAAGTGIVLSSDGLILTNNHVIEGSTAIQVTVESTGETYTATVVGTDATSDIAVLQLEDASGLTPMTLNDSSDDAVVLGDTVTDVGNAEGTGDLVAAEGTVTALDADITVGNELTGGTESLSGLIETDAYVVSGDSGGPLLDDDGEVIGVVTAASSGSSNVTGYAIPIDDAMAIVRQIESGVETETVHIGDTAFLGVSLAQSQSQSQSQSQPQSQVSGAVVGGVIENSPAAAAGLSQGDVITAVDGTAIADGSALSTAISSYEVGDTVQLTVTDAATGQQSTISATLVAGPAA